MIVATRDAKVIEVNGTPEVPMENTNWIDFDLVDEISFDEENRLPCIGDELNERDDDIDNVVENNPEGNGNEFEEKALI